MLRDRQKKSDKPVDGEVVFLRDIPKELKCAFKAACARRARTMTDVLSEAMREFVKLDGVEV
jgi:hypothetical protein